MRSLETKLMWKFTVGGIGASMVAIGSVGVAQAEEAAADPCDMQNGPALITERLASTQVDAIRCAPVPGWYEVKAGQNLFYMDPAARFLVVGGIYDLLQGKDVTAPRLAETGASPARPMRQPVRTLALDELPPAPIVHGDKGGEKLVIFSDPRCGYCRALHTALADMKGLEIHEYMAPILGGSGPIVEAVYCAEDRVAALDDAYAGRIKLTGDETCGAAESAAASAEMKRHGFTGTPVLVRADGVVQVGFPGKEQLKHWLEASNGE